MLAQKTIGRSNFSISGGSGAILPGGLCGLCGHLCAPDGRLLAMKGKRPDEEISAPAKAFRVLAVHRLKVPGLDDERHLVNSHCPDPIE